MIAALGFVRRIPGMLSPKGWLAVALLAAFLVFGAYCAHKAAEGERDRQAAERAKIEVKASDARETAADERLNDSTISGGQVADCRAHGVGHVHDGLRTGALAVEVAHGRTLARRAGFVESASQISPCE